MFTEDQKKVIEHYRGPALVVASPGAGKSTTAVARAIRLVERGEHPHAILLTTFSSAAAKDLNVKLAEQMPGSKVQARTVHSIGYEIIKRHFREVGKRSVPQVEDKKAYVIKKILGEPHEKYNPNGMDWKDSDPSFVCQAISYLKRNYIHFDDAQEFLEDLETPFAPRVAQAYRLYEGHLKYTNSVDFDDMLMLSSKLLEENDEIRKVWASKFDFIMMDECQDSNLIQYSLIKHLASHQNIMWIGDDFQSIYSFTGAIPEQAVYSFKDSYPTGKVYLLQHNFRSQGKVIDAANRLTTHMHNPFDKECVATRDESTDIQLMVFDTPSSEALSIAHQIKVESEGNPEYDFSSNAVIYRTNKQSRAVEDAMIANRIPYVIFGSMSFYNRREIKDMISYIRLAFSTENTDEDFKRVANIPSTKFKKSTRFLGKAFMMSMREEAESKGCDMWKAARTSFRLTRGQKAAIKDMEYMVKAILTADNAVEAIDWVMENGYKDFIVKQYGELDDEGESRVESVEELKNSISGFPSFEAFLDHMDRVEELEKDKQKGEFNGVNLLSIHRSKGLEWENVYLVGCHQGQLPFTGNPSISVKQVDDKRRLEEERRLAYVGVTRAKDNLTISFSQKDLKGNPTTPSQFIAEMELAV